MLKCRDIPALSSDYIDGAGPLGNRLGVAWHLRLCADCRAYVGSLRRTRSFVAGSLRTEIPPTLETALGLAEGQPRTPGRGQDR
jgi:anti-sigma factor RsiW